MFTRSLTLTVAIAGLTTSAGLTAVRSAHRSVAIPVPAAACTSSWSAPRALMIGTGYVMVDAPQVVATPEGTAFLGDNALAAEPTDSGFLPVVGWPRGAGMLAGIMIRPDGDVVPIPAPPGVRAFIAVRAVSDAGVAHVFWGGSADTSSLQFQHVNALWYAQFDGRRWTQPERIFADTSIQHWFPQPTAIVVAEGRAHVMTPLAGRMLGEDVLHVVRDAQGQGSVRRLGFAATYTSLAAYPDGVLVLATIRGKRPDRARVLMERSTDGGRSWSPPVEVYRSGLGTAYDPRVAVTPDGSLYAAWIVEAPNAASRAESIHVAMSTDRGTTWRPLPGLHGTPDVRDLWAVPDGQGAVHLSFHHDGNGGQVTGVRFERAQWEGRVTFGPTPFAANLYAVTPDSLVMAWPEWRTAGPERIPAMMVSRWTSCRDIPPER